MVDLSNLGFFTAATINGKKISFVQNNENATPKLAIPSFIHIARNTSAGVETIIPLKEFSRRVIVKEKNLENVNLNWIEQLIASNLLCEIRNNLEFLIIRALVKAAKNTQDKIIKVSGSENAIDFNNGAHLVTETITTSEQAYDSLLNASKILTNIELTNTKTASERGYFVFNKLIKEDILCLCSYKFLSLLNQNSVLIRQAPQYDGVFVRMGIKDVLGTDVLPSDMPRGINFILIATGKNSPFVYKEDPQGLEIHIENSQDCTIDKIFHCTYAYQTEIVNEKLVVASIDDNFEFPESTSITAV